MPEQNIGASADASPVAAEAKDFHAPHKGKRAEHPIFCAGCQAHTKHVVSVDHNDEFLATCDKCGRALKFPREAGAAPQKHAENLAAHLDAHHKANVGQIRVEVAQAKRDEIDKAFLETMGILSDSKG